LALSKGSKKMIDGVKTKKLKVLPDERGRLMEILRRDDDLFLNFGQVYMTTTYPSVVKAWHKHEKQTDNVACIQGMIKLALYDAREKSPTFKEVDEFYLGVHDPLLIQIPAGVYHGWMCVSQEEAVVINIPTEPYDYEHPDEQRLDPHENDIPYDWRRKDD
jgi:dTDP-4-dehydrorhamnose 3,5-epimerase